MNYQNKRYRPIKIGIRCRDKPRPLANRKNTQIMIDNLTNAVFWKNCSRRFHQVQKNPFSPTRFRHHKASLGRNCSTILRKQLYRELRFPRIGLFRTISISKSTVQPLYVVKFVGKIGFLFSTTNALQKLKLAIIVVC